MADILACPLPLEAYSVTQNSAKNAPEHLILKQKNIKNFFPGERVHPSSYSTPKSPPTLQKEILVTALTWHGTHAGSDCAHRATVVGERSRQLVSNVDTMLQMDRFECRGHDRAPGHTPQVVFEWHEGPTHGLRGYDRLV